jgi:ABC-2 type transport system ATP-binding protein
MRNLVKQLHTEQGKTIIVSSHLLAEIEKIATSLAIIHQGKVLFQGSLPELQAVKSGHAWLEIECDNHGKALQLLSRNMTVQLTNGKLTVGITDREQVAELNALLVQHAIKVYRLHTADGNLENLFMQIISTQL